MTTHVRRLLSLSSVALVVAAAACKDSTSTGPALVAPANVQATATSPTSVIVTWNVVPSADSYEVDRAETGGDFAMVSSGLSSTAYTDEGLTAGTQYRYRVRALSGTRTSPFSGEVSVGLESEGPRQRTIYGVTQSTTLHADTTYVLSGYVKVSNGATLTIEPGTRIVGDTLTPGSSLWILRGAKIMAEGTKDAPIVFTSQRSEGNRKPGDWGGLIIVGNAPINRTANPIFTEGPTGAAENYAGGTDFNDSSGSLRYVRVEFAGYDVSNGGGQELNSVSSYAVGRGTTYDYVEAIAGLDDGFESFGGGQDMRHIVSFETGDDHFDWTEGFAGRGQFLIALQTTVLQPRPGTGTTSSDPRGFEGDGCEIDKAGCTFANEPFSRPVWANFTVIGPGTGVFTATDGNGAVIRRGAAATMVNGIIARWPGVGISIRDAESEALVDADSTTIRNVILADNGSNFEPSGTNFGSVVSDNASAWNVSTASLSDLFGAVPGKDSPAADISAIDFTPKAGSAAATGGIGSFDGTRIAGRVQDFFGGAMEATSYVGAVDPSGSDNWWEGWTVYYTK